jgi:hypothetical protein
LDHYSGFARTHFSGFVRTATASNHTGTVALFEPGTVPAHDQTSKGSEPDRQPRHRYALIPRKTTPNRGTTARECFHRRTSPKSTPSPAPFLPINLSTVCLLEKELGSSCGLLAKRKTQVHLC